jgi:DUF4097 and DUF4098 domain-containing protein YvlB
VESSDRDDVEIEASLRATTQERLKGARVVADRDSAGALLVSVTWPGGKARNNEGCSFKITLPGARGVTVRTANGRVLIAGLEGAADLATSNGGIDVRGHDGDLKAHSSNGSLSVERVAGSVETGTSNGSVSVRDAGGGVQVRTSNGRIEIAEATGAVTARTSNGSIEIRLAGDGVGPVEANTSNGSVTLTIGQALGGELELRTSDASISVGDLAGATMVVDEKHHKRVRLDDSSSRSRVQTSNGSIRVRMR